MKRYVSSILATIATCSILCWHCHASNLRRTFPSWLAESSDESNRHRRITHTQCSLEDEFFYDTEIEMKAYGSTLECGDTELDEIGVALTIAHQNVIQEDPRLEDVIELLLNMCDTPTAIARGRMLTFKKKKNGFGFNWGGSGRCRWCPRDNDCDAACRLRRFLWRGNWNGNRNGRFKREWEWERIWNGENNPGLNENKDRTDSPSPPPIPAPTPPTNDGSAGNLARFVATANPTTSSPIFPPTARPSPAPTPAPTSSPTSSPTGAPSISASAALSDVPSVTPSAGPTVTSSAKPSGSPSVVRSAAPSLLPSDAPSVAPSVASSGVPSVASSDAPSVEKSDTPSVAPSVRPSLSPSDSPTVASSGVASVASSDAPTVEPSAIPSAAPSVASSGAPSVAPSTMPSAAPSVVSSGTPSVVPSGFPTGAPSVYPSVAPSGNPSAAPTPAPIATSFADSTTTSTNGIVNISDVVDRDETKSSKGAKGTPLRVADVTSDRASLISSLDETKPPLSQKATLSPLLTDSPPVFEEVTLNPLPTETTPPVTDKDASRISGSSSPVGEVTGFRLWSTIDEDNPQFLKIIEHADILDIQLYGSSLTIEADYSGDVDKVVFDFDDQLNYRTENHPPYMLASDNGEGRFNTMVELSDVGTHTITATPYSSDGEKLTSVMFAILIVDGSTNAVQSAAPGSREELINILEDDLIFYLSGEVNKQFFFRPGHCLEGNLVFMDVVLTETSEKKAACETDVIPTAAPTPSTAGPITSALYTQECLDVFEGSTADGAPIVQSPCASGKDSQMWNFVPIDDDNGRSYYQIRALHSGKCMGVESPSSTFDSAIVQLPCGTESNKLFLLAEIETDHFIATTEGAFRCIGIDASSSVGSIQQQECLKLSITQRWDIGAVIPVPTGAPTPTPLPGYTPAPTPLESEAGPIEIELSGKCVDVTDVDSHSDRSQIIQNDCQGPGRLSQMWIFVPVDSVNYQIRASHSHKCIGVLDAATNDNALVVQLPCGTEPHKLWRIRTPASGGQMLQAKHSDSCLEVYDWDEGNGVGLVQNFCSNVLNQKFDIKTVIPAYN